MAKLHFGSQTIFSCLFTSSLVVFRQNIDFCHSVIVWGCCRARCRRAKEPFARLGLDHWYESTRRKVKQFSADFWAGRRKLKSIQPRSSITVSLELAASNLLCLVVKKRLEETFGNGANEFPKEAKRPFLRSSDSLRYIVFHWSLIFSCVILPLEGSLISAFTILSLSDTLVWWTFRCWLCSKSLYD